MKTIKQWHINTTDEKKFKYTFVGCIVLTQDKKILLQKIVHARKFFPPGSISTFGGRIEKNETPLQALIRELKEELGAIVKEHEPVYLGAITEAVTCHSELIHAYFWQDKQGTITGCYEDEEIVFDSMQQTLDNCDVTDEVRWMLKKYQMSIRNLAFKRVSYK